MPGRPLTDEEFRKYILTGQKPEGTNAEEQAKEYFGVTDTAPVLGLDAANIPEQGPIAPEIQSEPAPMPTPEVTPESIPTLTPEDIAQMQNTFLSAQDRGIPPAQFREMAQEPVLPPGSRLTASTLEGVKKIRDLTGEDVNPLSGIPPYGAAPTKAHPAEDLPLAQAQATQEAQDMPVESAKTGHPDEMLKATDANKVDAAAADAKLQSDDPIAYIMKKFNINDDELRKAQAEADDKRDWSRIASGLLETGYLFKNMQMPAEQRAFYENQMKEAERPIERIKQRQEAQKEKFATAKIGMDAAKDAREMLSALEDDKLKSDPTSPAALMAVDMANKHGFNFVPGKTDLKTIEKTFKSMGLGLKDFIKKSGTQRSQIKNMVDPQTNKTYATIIDPSNLERVYNIDGKPIDPEIASRLQPAWAPSIFKDVEGNTRLVDRTTAMAAGGAPGTTTQGGIATVSSSARKPAEQMTKEEQAGQVLTAKQRDDIDNTEAAMQKAYGDVLNQSKGLINVRAMIDDARTNPLELAALKTGVAKTVLREVGNLAEHDKEGITEAQSIKASLEQYINTKMTGTITVDNLNFIESMVNRIEAENHKLIKHVYDGYKKKLGAFGIAPQRVDETLGVTVKPLIPEYFKAPTKTGGLQLPSVDAIEAERKKRGLK